MMQLEQQNLPALEQRLRAVLDAIPDLVVVLDADGRYRDIYTGDVALLVQPPDRLLGRTVADVLAPETARQIRDVIAQTLASGCEQRCEYAVQRHQRQIWLSARVVPFSSKNDPCVLWVARDITERKQAEDSLRAAEARLAEAQRVGRIGSWDWNTTTGELWWSEQLFHLFGVEPGQFQPSYDAFLEFVLDEDRPLVTQRVAASLERGEPFLAEYRIRRANGELLLLAAQAQLKQDAAGQFRRLVGIVQDVAEQRRIHAQARRAQRLASLGTLAGGIAHEINNPICAAGIAVDTALKVKHDPQAGETLNECLETIASAVQRCQMTIQNVLKLARQQPSIRQPYDLNEIVRQAHATTRHYALQRGASVDLLLGELLRHPTVNALEIEQVLVNVIRNAVQSRGHHISVSTESVADELHIRVCDDGHGIPAEDLEQIFDPFFTRGASGENTGLGLYISHTIVTDHGGRMEVESELGKSTTFIIKLPTSRPVMGNEPPMKK